MIMRIVITGKRHQDNMGNTYHTATCERFDATGELIERIQSDIRYGYDRQYMDTAGDVIERAGWVGDARRKVGRFGGKTPTGRWLDELGIDYHEHTIDVASERELTGGE